MIPAVLWAAVACSTLPVLAGLVGRREGFLWWALLAGALANLLSLGMALARLDTLFLSYVYPPLEVALLAAYLAKWPALASWRQGLAGLAVVVTVASVYALASEIPTPRMGTVVYPAGAFVLVAALLVALTAPQAHRWVILGLLLYLVPVAILQPLFYSPIGKTLYQVVQGMQVAAYLVLTVAFLTPHRRPEGLRVA